MCVLYDSEDNMLALMSEIPLRAPLPNAPRQLEAGDVSRLGIGNRSTINAPQPLLDPRAPHCFDRTKGSATTSKWWT
jgi:hypothetical protein